MTDNCLDDPLCFILLRVINTLDGRCCRTKIQKVAYFLDLETKPRFSFYHYGPRSGDVEAALDYLELHGYVTTERTEQGTLFVSTPWGKHSAVGIPQDALEVLEFLGGMSLRELELISTIHFVWTVHFHKGEDECWKIVTELKPSVRPIEICRCLGRLINQGYLK